MIAVQTTESNASISAFGTASAIYRKTPAGYAELQQRTSTRIALRTRWTLVMIDGKTPAASMIERLGGVGIDETVFAELVSHGLIEPLPRPTGPTSPIALDGPACAASARTVSTESTERSGQAKSPEPRSPELESPEPELFRSGRSGPELLAMADSPGLPGSSLTTHRAPPAVDAVDLGTGTERDRDATAKADANVSSEPQRQAELYAFFCSTIRDLIGLRGMFLQLAVESAGSLDDYRALRERYLTAVARAKGPTIAAALRARLDTLLE